MREALRLRLAAGACFLSALLGAAYLPSVVRGEDQWLANGIALVSLALYVFILLTLREALARLYGHDIPRWLVAILIAGHAGLVISSSIDDVSPLAAPVAIGLVWLSAFATAVGLFVLGFRLLGLRRELGALGVTFSALVMLEGMLFATMVFMANAILVAVLADAVLGLLLLRLAGGRAPARHGVASA